MESIPVAHAVLVAEATNVEVEDEEKEGVFGEDNIEAEKPFAPDKDDAREQNIKDDIGPASVEQLIAMMSQSYDDYHLVASRVGQDHWQPIFSSLTPTGYGRLFEQVHLEVHHLPVATTLALAVGESFVCDHVMQALPHMSDYTRSILVEQILPMCKDALTKFWWNCPTGTNRCYSVL